MRQSNGSRLIKEGAVTGCFLFRRVIRVFSILHCKAPHHEEDVVEHWNRNSAYYLRPEGLTCVRCVCFSLPAERTQVLPVMTSTCVLRSFRSVFMFVSLLVCLFHFVLLLVVCLLVFASSFFLLSFLDLSVIFSLCLSPLSLSLSVILPSACPGFSGDLFVIFQCL